METTTVKRQAQQPRPADRMHRTNKQQTAVYQHLRNLMQTTIGTARRPFDMPYIDGSSTGAHRRCSRLVNVSEAAPATVSLQFRPLPVAVSSTLTSDQWVRLPAWSFLLVFYSNHSPKMHRCLATDMRQTNGQTDRQTDERTNGSQLCQTPPTVGEGHKFNLFITSTMQYW